MNKDEYFNLKEVSNRLKELLSNDNAYEHNIYNLILNKIFEQPLFQDFSSQRLYRTQEGLSTAFHKNILNKDTENFVNTSRHHDFNNVSLSNVLSEKDKLTLNEIKSLFNKHENNSSDFFAAFEEYYNDMSKGDKDNLSNLIDKDDLNLWMLKSLLYLVNHFDNKYSSTFEFFSMLYNFGDANFIESSLRGSNILFNQVKSDKLGGSFIEIFLKDNFIFNRKRIQGMGYKNYLDLVEDLTSLESFNETIAGIFIKSTSRENFLLNIFDSKFKEIKEEILSSIEINLILKSKEDLYKKYNVDYYFAQLIKEFPLLLKENETFKNATVYEKSDLSDNVKQKELLINSEEELFNFINNTVNVFNIFDKESFFKNENIKKQIEVEEYFGNIGKDCFITLDSRSLINFNYHFNLVHDKKNNIVYPNLMILSTGEDVYKEAIYDLLDYCAKNNLILKNPTTSFFKQKFELILDDIDNLVEKYNNQNENKPVVYFHSWTDSIEDLFKELKVKDYNIISKFYLEYFNDPSDNKIEDIRKQLSTKKNKLKNN